MATAANPTFGPFRGMNNRLPDTAMRTKEGDWLRSAVNLDLTAGRLRLRPGYSLKQAGSDVHSLWGDGGAFGFYVDGTTLYRIRSGPDGGITRTELRTDLTAHAAMSFDRNEAGDVYYSNGIECGRDTGATHTADWGAWSAVGNTPSVHCRSMPAAMSVRFFRNRLIAARGPTLFCSEPWKFNLYSPLDGLIPFLGAVTMLEPLESGAFAATSTATYWLPGDLVQDAQVRQVLPYGALPGSGRRVRGMKAAIWMSPRGMVRGTDDGAVANLQEGAVATGTGDSAATLYREYDGAHRAVAAVSNSQSSVAAARSYMDAEIVRKGTTL
jgi:hypothetical protein